MTVKNLTITLEQGRNNTCRFPRFSALLIAFKASLRTFIRTMAESQTLQALIKQLIYIYICNYILFIDILFEIKYFPTRSYSVT